MVVFHLQTADLSPVVSVDFKRLARAEKQKFKHDWLCGWKVEGRWMLLRRLRSAMWIIVNILVVAHVDCRTSGK